VARLEGVELVELVITTAQTQTVIMPVTRE
jgi:hypothetical protein